MYLCALGKTVAKHIDMGVMIITPENMDSPEAQKLLMEYYFGAVYRYLRVSVRDPEAAADLAQDFALRFVRGDFKKADPSRGRSWRRTRMSAPH